jgi:hypothetical protein
MVKSKIKQIYYSFLPYVLPIYHCSAKIPILPPIFTVDFRELRGIISRTVWIRLVSPQFPSLSWFKLMILVVKF